MICQAIATGTGLSNPQHRLLSRCTKTKLKKSQCSMGQTAKSFEDLLTQENNQWALRSSK